MPLIKCPECGKNISDKAVKCPNCGSDMRVRANSVRNDLVQCSECGALMDKNSVSCPNCGNPINKPATIVQQCHAPNIQQQPVYAQPTYPQQSVQQPYTQPQYVAEEKEEKKRSSFSKGMEVAAWIIWVAGIAISYSVNSAVGLAVCSLALVLWIISTLTSISSPISKVIQIIADALWVISCFAYFLSNDEGLGGTLLVVAIILWVIAGALDKKV